MQPSADSGPTLPAAAMPNAMGDAASAAPFDARRGSHWFVHVGSPLGISLVLHALVLAVFAGITWVVVQRHEEIEQEFEAKIIAEGAPGGPIGGFQFPGNAMLDRPDSARGTPTEAAGSGLTSLLDRHDAVDPVAAAGQGSEGIGAGDLGRGDVIGTGGGGGALAAPGLGSGLGDRDAAGGGPVGGLWGVGHGQRAKTVVYVVDRSGSFVDWVDAIDVELKRSLGVLREDQMFNIIFLRDDKPQAFKPRLVKADEAGKREAFVWINMNPPSGGSDLSPAVRAALAFAPEIMFIVTDQEFLNSASRSTNMREMLNVVRAARKKIRTTVNVILMGPFQRPTGDAAELHRRLNDERQRLSPEQVSKLREEAGLLDAIEAMQTLPNETGGSFDYLNGDLLMEQWRKTHRESQAP